MNVAMLCPEPEILPHLCDCELIPSFWTIGFQLSTILTRRMRGRALLQPFSGVLLPVLCISLTSCSTAKAPRSHSVPDAVKLTSFWQPQLLYILPWPHSRLYVEVDAVEGCQPSDARLNKLRDFLTTYCNKPDSIEIVRGDVIPIQIARGIPPRALARKFLNGPPENESPAAYMYVLFYNNALSDEPIAAGTNRSKATTASHLDSAPRNPHVDCLPYPPVMFMNSNYGAKRYQTDLLLHEAGHELGLASRNTFASDFHCTDKTCLMNWTLRVHLGRYLLGMDPIKQHHLCAHCITQLTESAKQSPPTNLRFVGPVLVRSETNYHVLNLPDRVKVIVGQLTDRDCRDFASAVRAEKVPPENDDLRVDWLIKDEVFEKPTLMTDSFEQVKADPYEPVRMIAPTTFAQFCFSHGQFTNAINMCREAVAKNPQDAWSYNTLAWIKATCPDASVRNGSEAVSAATQACELTRWKLASLIDTLAAACAESGDFQRAIRLQKQALLVSNAPESERGAMQERLALYKQSQPYHETH
jgi:tetratricopeptide (TPR) repeat protein